MFLCGAYAKLRSNDVNHAFAVLNVRNLPWNKDFCENIVESAPFPLNDKASLKGNFDVKGRE